MVYVFGAAGKLKGVLLESGSAEVLVVVIIITSLPLLSKIALNNHFRGSYFRVIFPCRPSPMQVQCQCHFDTKKCENGRFDMLFSLVPQNIMLFHILNLFFIIIIKVLKVVKITF